jgi:tRNA-modifying protein YgfZ
MMPPTPLHAVEAQAGAVFVEEAGRQVPEHFGDTAAEYRAAREGAALFDVSHRAKVEVRGREAAFFLHNLATNDVRGLAEGSGCETFFTNQKARIVAHARAFLLEKKPDEQLYLLDADPGAGGRIVQHLDRHLISEQVEMADRTGDFAAMHLAGPRAFDVLERVFGDAVPDLDQLKQRWRAVRSGVDSYLLRLDPLGVPGFDVACPPEQAPKIWTMLRNAGALPAGRGAWEPLRIEAGTPRDGADFDDSVLVMEVGRTPLAISYTKGCFLGQEPIVRARDLGHVNRTLLGVKIQGAQPMPRGTKLVHAGQDAGQVTSSAFSPGLDTVVALAYVRRGHQQPGTILEVAEEGSTRTAEVVALPFVVAGGGGAG